MSLDALSCIGLEYGTGLEPATRVMSPTSYQLLHPAMWVPLPSFPTHDLGNSGRQMSHLLARANFSPRFRKGTRTFEATTPPWCLTTNPSLSPHL